MKVFSGTANLPLAEGICKYLGISLGKLEISRFPDGEILIRYEENIRGSDVFLIQSMSYPPNEHLMELLIMIDAARRASPSRITVVTPFFAYARQDRKDRPRVPISAKLVANLLVAAGANRILAMDLHSQQIQGFFDIPVDHLTALPVISGYLRKKELKNPVVVAPDSGAVKMAVEYAEALGCRLVVGAKYRRGPNDVKTINIVGEVKDCSVIMVDDIVSTGGTLCEVAEVLKDMGAVSIYAAVTHFMAQESAVERLKNSHITEIITTDTYPVRMEKNFNIKILSVAELFGEAIKRIHENRSVSDLFKLRINRQEELW